MGYNFFVQDWNGLTPFFMGLKWGRSFDLNCYYQFIKV